MRIQTTSLYLRLLTEGKWREVPNNLPEKLAYDQAKARGSGKPILDRHGNLIIHKGGPPGTRKALRKDHIKGAAVHKHPDGNITDIHYYEHPVTGERIDLKFKEYPPKNRTESMSLHSRVFGGASISEAVKGGFQSDTHEIHGSLAWKDKDGNKQTAPLTHGFDGVKQRSIHDGIKEYHDVIKNPDFYPKVSLSVIKKTKAGEDPKDRFYHSEYEGGQAYNPVSKISVGHAPWGTPGDPGDDHHFSTKFVSTNPSHTRKGWASTLFDHAHTSLKKHGIHLTHDGTQLQPGKRWAARQETARGKGFVPIHRKAQADTLSALAVHTKITDDFPEHKDHHTKMIDIANKILDRVGGYHGKSARRTFQKAIKRAGIPALGGRKTGHFMNALGGANEAIPKKQSYLRNKGLPPWSRE